MSKRGWDRTLTDGNLDPRYLEMLAWKILFPLNPYPNALRLGSGGETTTGYHDDEDFWLQCVRGNEATMKWKHTPNGGTETEFTVRRAARIPYLVKNNAGKHSLDHLLVGYSDRGAVTTPPDHRWDTLTAGNSSNPQFPNLYALGTFLTDDLWLRDEGNLKRVTGWDAAGGTWGYEESALYSGSTTWGFRELNIKPEKSVVIFMVAKKGNAYTKWALLVGYEGGGAW